MSLLSSLKSLRKYLPTDNKTIAELPKVEYCDAIPLKVENPFQLNNIESINLWMYKRKWMGETSIIFNARVEFKDKTTDGTKKFEGNSFEELIMQIESYLKTI